MSNNSLSNLNLNTNLQYIQPDTEEVPINSRPAENAAPSSSSGAAGGASSFFSSFTTPKVDLSSAFKPFAQNASTGNNKVKERQYTGGDTLDEPVWHTLRRDLAQIGKRVAIVVWPMQLQSLASKQQLRLIDFAQSNGVLIPDLILNSRMRPAGRNNNLNGGSNFDEDDFEINDEDEDEEANVAFEDTTAALIKNNLDWDLWGPLIFSLVYSVSLGLASPNLQTNQVFSGTFSFIWLFSLAIGLNIQLLGGNISFMSAISASGYSLFPIVVGSLLCSLIIKWKLIRLVMMVVLCAWSIYSGVLSLKCSGVLPGRVLLAIYPIGLMYAVLGWLCVIT